MRSRHWISVMVLLATDTLFGTPTFALESVLTLDEAKALLGGGVVGESLPGAPLPDSRSLLPSIPGAHIYDVISGKKTGKKRSK